MNACARGASFLLLMISGPGMQYVRETGTYACLFPSLGQII